jgi:hypothetical protein
MRFAYSANSFRTQHTVGCIGSFFDRMRIAGFEKAGPSTACVKFGVRRKQWVVATDTSVNTFVPMGFIATGERAFGGRMTRHLVGHGFGILSG